ncbi:hypothetical protein [Nautilia sp.]
MKRLISLSLAAAASLLIIGCGSGSSVTDANINYEQQNIFTAIPVNVNYKDYNVYVYDDEIKGAQVRAFECNSSKKIGGGFYVLQNCVSKPSYIVVEGGVIGDSNVIQTFPLVLNVSKTSLDDNFVVTPLTTLIADANDSEIETLANKLGIDKSKLFVNPQDVSEINMTNILQKVNAIYLKAESDGAVSNKLKFVQTVRSVLENNVTIKGGDFNVTDVAAKVQIVSQSKPAMFGLVFIRDLNNTTDILNEIKEIQNPSKVTFLGLVFDKIIPNADIRVYRADNDSTLATAKADSYGKWEVEFNDTAVKEIEDNDFVVIFEAADPTNPKIVLTSSMSSKKLADMIRTFRKISPTKSPDLIISNVTTAENAILKKRGALSGGSDSYESNKTNIKTYYSDRVLKASAVLKKVVDNNDTSGLGTQNTFEYIENNINNPNDVNFTSTIADQNTTAEEQNITENSMLRQQINFIPSTTQAEENQVTFETAANENGNVFYRILAYYDNGTFIREYDKIVTLPGYYEVKKCYLEGSSTGDWYCPDDEKTVINTANFSSGNYNAQNNGVITSYSLEGNQSIFVSEVCKSYNVYEVSKQTLIGNDVDSTEPEVLVDSFDIVDVFRRMPDIDNKSFVELQDLVNGKTRDEVNTELNRFVREQIDKVEEYFSDNNTSTTCQ